MAAVPGDVSAASGCGNRVEEAFEQFLRGAVTEYLAGPSIEITRIGIPKKITPLLDQLEGQSSRPLKSITPTMSGTKWPICPQIRAAKPAS
ncbi:hypothetical protein NBH08_09890 [Faecalicatena sp. BF-R-105]|nr:hypothetical protein [Faecalicatena sp. BF-R-105]